MNKTLCKRINTKDIFSRYCDREKSDNIEVYNKGIRLKTTWGYTGAREIAIPSALEIVDLAVDNCDRVLLLTGSALYVYDRLEGTFMEPGCGGPELSALSFFGAAGIGTDRDTVYIADNPATEKGISGRVTAFARSNYQIRWVVNAGPEGEALGIVRDLMAGSDDTIWFIETTGQPDEGKGRLLALGRDGKYLSFGITGTMFTGPSDIAAGREKDIFILSGDGVSACRYDDHARHYSGVDGPAIPVTSASGIADGRAKSLAVTPDGQFITGILPEGDEGLLDPPPLYTRPATGSPGTRWTPLWVNRGTVLRIVLDSANNMYVISGDGKKFFVITYGQTVRKNAAGRYEGTYVSVPVDSTIEKARWHRFLLQGTFMPGTQVGFGYSASDSEVDILTAWQDGLPASSSGQGTGVRDGLFPEKAMGRYLRFRIVLTGTEHISPSVTSVSLYFPRITWLEYLPRVYRDDPAACGFLERFLSLFESSFTETDEIIENIGRLIDPEGTPDTFVDWLGSWLAVSAGNDWPTEKKRLLIQRAASLYKKRGTCVGLEEMIELFSGKRPFIVELLSGSCRSPCPQDATRNCVAGEGRDRIFFPPDDARVVVPSPFIFRWNEAAGKDCRRLLGYLRIRYPSLDISVLKVTRVDNVVTIRDSKGPLVGTFTLSDDNSRVTLFMDSAITGISQEMSNSTELCVKMLECDMIVFEHTIGLRELLYGNEPFYYYVFIQGEPPPGAPVLDTIRRIIEEQRPAHTCYGLRVLEPWFSLDRHTYLGVNTVMARPTFVLGRDAVLARDTVLGDRENGGQIGYHSGIGTTSDLT